MKDIGSPASLFKIYYSFFLELAGRLVNTKGARKTLIMPVNGLLLTLSTDQELADKTRAQISLCPETTLGQANERWQPLVAETPNVKAAHDFHEWLESLPGVEQVDVIYAGFEDSSPTETDP